MIIPGLFETPVRILRATIPENVSRLKIADFCIEMLPGRALLVKAANAPLKRLWP